MPASDVDWPAPRGVVESARELVRALPRTARVVVACDRDVDGLSGGVVLLRAMERRGHEVQLVVARRGEHPHTDSMRERLRAAAPDLLLVVDIGSRPGPIVPGVPTIVVDHHRPSGTPDDALLVSAHGCEPIVSSSWLAHHFASELAEIADLEWLAVLGAYGDLGASADLPGYREALSRAGRKDVGDAVSLLNAARRAAVPIEDVAARALLEAESAADVARGRVVGSEALAEARASVAAETARCGRVAPRVVGDVALIRFSSGAQVHPLIATRWMQRLRGKIVIVANDGYLPNRVNFAVRSTRDVDLLAFLEEHAPRDKGSEYGHGHARATGGSLTREAFEDFLSRLGFAAAPAAARV